MAGAWQDMPGSDRYIAAHYKYMACTFFSSFWNVFSLHLSPAYHVVRMCCVCWHIQTSENYPQVWKLDGGIIRLYPSYTSIYHAIPSSWYDGISRYMSGYQGVRIPDAGTLSVEFTDEQSMYSVQTAFKLFWKRWSFYVQTHFWTCSVLVHTLYEHCTKDVHSTNLLQSTYIVCTKHG